MLVHVELTTNEHRLTWSRDQASEARQVNVRLRLQVAQLESPARIVTRAQQLGMVPPPSILYLTAAAGRDPDASPAAATPAASTTG